jgi:hypothetical protein
MARARSETLNVPEEDLEIGGTMTDTAIPMTNAERDRAASAAAVEAANIRLEELKTEYANNPEQRLSRDKAELERLQSDPTRSDGAAGVARRLVWRPSLRLSERRQCRVRGRD